MLKGYLQFFCNFIHLTQFFSQIRQNETINELSVTKNEDVPWFIPASPEIYEPQLPDLLIHNLFPAVKVNEFQSVFIEYAE